MNIYSARTCDKLNETKSKKDNKKIEKFNTNMDSKEAYDKWMSQYLNQGQRPTHMYTCNFQRRKYIVVEKNCCTGDSCGLDARHVISLNGNNIKVGGDCRGYVIKEGKAITICPSTPNSVHLVPIHTDFEYNVKEQKKNQKNKVTPLNDELIRELINSKGMNEEEVTKLICLRYENFIAGVFTHFHTFPQDVIKTIKLTPAVRAKYLDVLLNQVEDKYKGIYLPKMYSSKQGIRYLIPDKKKISVICEAAKGGIPNTAINGSKFTALGKYEVKFKETGKKNVIELI